ncbi:retrovirus-related pol polyprotein from transposon TNT 1-94 [Tanacetum coccineum]|uniref:Retrovirus-related pol polyprotein from transposon TNT 1-94 n=1 Tax=Tanacetum coccineum TaxID=301880 RepID=A0ABQ4WMP2_9ASTR
MICYLTRMEPYYIQCIKDGPFQPKTAEGDNKPESQWTPDERRLVSQDQRLKRIIISCLPDDIIESVISYETAKATRTDLVHSFEGPFDTNENKIMDLKLEYQTFRTKSSKTISQTYTRYKTLINEVTNDGVTLSKHEINTLDLANIYGRFVYEDNLISRRHSNTKKALITTPSDSPISTTFFSNNIAQDFQENSNDEADERSCKEYLRDLELEFHERNKGLVAETFDWDKEKVSDDEEETQVKVLMAFVDDELSVGKNHARNGECIDITMKKGASPILEVMTLTYQDHSPRERSGLGIMKHTKTKTVESSNKNVSGPVTVSDTKPVTSSVPNKPESSKFVNSSKQSQDSKPNGKNPDSSKPVRPKPLQKPKLKCDIYVLDMSSLTPNGAFFFAKASESVNWLCHKRLSHLNFKNINKLAKQNKVLGILSLVYLKDKPCFSCEKIKHKRASFKTKQNFSIRKCLHLFHMDLFGHVSPISINHEKYTLVIVDEYSRYTWVYFLKNKSQTAKMIMSFVRLVENQNDVKVKQIRTDNGTEFRNSELESFCDEKGISQKFSFPYILEQNSVAEKKNRTLIKAAKTMLNISVLSKYFWTKAVRIACYTHNRSIIVKRYDRTHYEIFIERIPNIIYFHVFECPVLIHNHKDHLGKFDAKANDGYFLGYSFNSKAFRVYNTRRQQIEETYHVTFDVSIEAIKFINTSVDKIGIDDSSKSIAAKLTAAKLTAASASECLFPDFLFEIELKKISKALKHPGWVDSMQEELNQFYRNKVWTLVSLPYGKIAIGSN